MYAGSTASGEEFLSTFEAVPPNVLFLLDLSSAMDADCGEVGDSGDTASNGTTLGTSCLDSALDAIDKLVQHFSWAEYGVIGTASSASNSSFYEIAALGSSNAEISDGLVPRCRLTARPQGTWRRRFECRQGLFRPVQQLRFRL